MPDRKFISFLKKCEAAKFKPDHCSELYFADKLKYRPQKPMTIVLTELRLERAKKKHQTAKVKKEEVLLKSQRKTYKALRRWFRETMN
jgi:hypothetical protein